MGKEALYYDQFSAFSARNQRLLRSYYVFIIYWTNPEFIAKPFFFLFLFILHHALLVLALNVVFTVHAHETDLHVKLLKFIFGVNILWSILYRICSPPTMTASHLQCDDDATATSIFGAFMNEDNFGSAVKYSASVATTPTTITWKWLIKKVFCAQREQQRRHRKNPVNCSWKKTQMKHAFCLLHTSLQLTL